MIRIHHHEKNWVNVLSGSIPNFVERIQNELEKFVNTDNFVIPHGVAVNQAVSLFSSILHSFYHVCFRFVNISFPLLSVLSLEHLCVSSVHQVRRLFYKIVYVINICFLGQSKTLSFQIVLQNLQGSQLSTKSFCKRLPEIDPFFCLGSKYSRSEDIAYVFERAIKREQQYQQNRIDTRCVNFILFFYNSFVFLFSRLYSWMKLHYQMRRKWF